MRLNPAPDSQILTTILERRPRVFTMLATAPFVFTILIIGLPGLAAVIVAFRSAFSPMLGRVTIFVGAAILIAFQVAVAIVSSFWQRSIARRVRRASYHACPNCLFNLSDLTSLERCPECGFDVTYLDLPGAWKALFRWAIRSTAERDRY